MRPLEGWAFERTPSERQLFSGQWLSPYADTQPRSHATTLARNHAHTQMEDTINIEEARAEDPEALREALVGQFGHLADEVMALRTVVDGLPDAILEGRPEQDALTMKELYGAIATLDAGVRRTRMNRVLEEEDPALEPVDVEAEVRAANWNEQDIGVILDEVKATRRDLTETLEELPLSAWHRTATLEDETLSLFALVYRMTQEDFQRLRDLGYRLHGAHLSDRDEPLPT